MFPPLVIRPEVWYGVEVPRISFQLIRLQRSKQNVKNIWEKASNWRLTIFRKEYSSSHTMRLVQNAHQNPPIAVSKDLRISIIVFPTENHSRLFLTQERNIVHFYDNNTKITGVFGELWNTLAEYLNFTWVEIPKNFNSQNR